MSQRSRRSARRRPAGPLTPLVAEPGFAVAWADSVALWDHAVRVSPSSYLAHQKLGDALADRGSHDHAASEYRQERLPGRN
jgi:hypothetical protein